MIEVRPLASRANRLAFVRLPGRLAEGDPNWIEPLHIDRLEMIDPRRNAFLHHAKAAFWLAWRDGRAVGRISAQLDPRSPVVEGAPAGSFGLPAFEDDPEIARALVGEAARWLAARGARVMRGPFDLSINEESGVLVEGFETPPFMLMPHDRPWTGRLLEAAGCRPVRDLLAYRMDVSEGLPRQAMALADRPLGAVTIRPLDMRRFGEEVRTVCAIFNDAWAGNFGFVPLGEAEMAAMARKMRPIVDPRLVQIAEIAGRPVAFIVLLPNVNEALAGMRGRLLPFGWARLAWMILGRRIRSGRVPLMGVVRDMQATALGAILPIRLIAELQPRARERGIGTIEMGWVLEENMAVRRMIERVGGREAKRLRLYERAVE